MATAHLWSSCCQKGCFKMGVAPAIQWVQGPDSGPPHASEQLPAVTVMKTRSESWLQQGAILSCTLEHKLGFAQTTALGAAWSAESQACIQGPMRCHARVHSPNDAGLVSWYLLSSISHTYWAHVILHDNLEWKGRFVRKGGCWRTCRRLRWDWNFISKLFTMIQCGSVMEHMHKIIVSWSH